MKISTPKRFTKIGRIKNIQVIYVKSAPFPNGKAGALGKNPAQHSAKFLKKKKHQDCSWYSLYWHYLAFRVGQGLSVPWEQSGGLSQALFVGKRKKHQDLSWCFLCWHYLSSRAVARQVLSAQASLTSVFGMGTGGPSLQSIPTLVDGSSPSFMSKACASNSLAIIALNAASVKYFW